MYKMLVGVLLLAAVGFGDVIRDIITIDLPVAKEGWDHKNATLFKVNLESYLQGKTIESAYLNFTGIQNLREPEADDSLHISLLQLTNAKGATVQDTIINDGEDNDNTLNEGNYFKNKDNNVFTWVEGVSNLEGYTDDNDNYGKTDGSYLDSAKCKAWTDHYLDGWYYVDWIDDGKKYHYANGGSGYGYGLWQKIENYTTEDFIRDLDVNNVNYLLSNSNGWLGIGIDADCHYTGNVQLVVTTTQSVPEPGSLSLLLLGLTSLTGAFIIRKRKR